MNVVLSALHRIATALDNAEAKWALVGGFAVSARAEPRFTRDVDVAVAVSDDAAAESLVRSMLVRGYDLAASIEQDATGRLATVRLASMLDEEVLVDLLFASSGIEPEIAAAADIIEIMPDLTIPVAATGHLVATKLLARDDRTRPQDLADLRALLAVATPADLDQARAATALIMQRGFNRDRDLPSLLADALSQP